VGNTLGSRDVHLHSGAVYFHRQHFPARFYDRSFNSFAGFGFDQENYAPAATRTANFAG
jgi:hypothetical protein